MTLLTESQRASLFEAIASNNHHLIQHVVEIIACQTRASTLDQATRYILNGRDASDGEERTEGRTDAAADLARLRVNTELLLADVKRAPTRPLLARFQDALDCCGTCAGGVLSAEADRLSAERSSNGGDAA